MRSTAVLLASTLVLAAAPALAFGPQTYTAKSVEIEGVFGTVTVKVDPSARDVTVSAGGSARWLQEFEASQSGDALLLEQRDRPERMRLKDTDDQITVDVTVPPGTALILEDHAGNATIGDLDAAVTLEDLQTGRIVVGRVTAADVGITGGAAVEIGAVGGPLNVTVSGSGDIKTGPVSGNVMTRISGSGDVVIGSVNGKVDTKISGSGNVELGGGRADPLIVGISGSGNVKVMATVGAQEIRNSGSGKVTIGNPAN